MVRPGNVALIGSGETAARGGQAFDLLARHLPVPLRVGVMETPAGFEINSAQVAGRVVEYLRKRLQNFQPNIDLIPARRRGPGGTDDWDTLAPLMAANLVFMGPGSPTYTVRQLKDSLAWEILRARLRMGASIALASAATVAVGALALPVYEIFKVGEDPHWKPGLNLLADFGLNCVIVPHWNNTEGGSDVDTGRCFIGLERFATLRELLPPDMTVVGIDEHSGVILDFNAQTCRVTGRDGVHILRGDNEPLLFCSGETFSMSLIGNCRFPERPEDGIDPRVWDALQAVEADVLNQSIAAPVPEEVERLLLERQSARERRDWKESDRLRDAVGNLGWKITDTPDGQKLDPA